MVGVAAGYFIAARLALILAVPPGYASPIWPAAGIALAVVLVYGPKCLPGVLLGSFAANFVTAVQAGGNSAWVLSPVLLALGIGTGAMLQAWCGAALAGRVIKGDLRLTSQSDVLRFMFWAGAVGSIVSPLIGILNLLVHGVIRPEGALTNGLTWWMGDAIGVFLFVPLTFLWIGRPADIWSARRARLVWPAVVLFLIIGAVFVSSTRLEEQNMANQFKAKTDRFEQDLRNRINGYVNELLLVKSFYDSSDYVSRREFHDYTQRLLKKDPGIKAIEWIRSVSLQERTRAVSEARNDGFNDFMISELNEKGELVEAGVRDHYLPVYYVEPYEGNERVLGFDLASKEDRRAYLLKARDTGTPSASVVIKLVQDKEVRPSFLISVPVYEKNLEPDPLIQAKRKYFKGCLVKVLDIGKLMEEVKLGSSVDNMRISIWDRTDPGKVRYVYGMNESKEPSFESLSSENKITVVDRVWSIRTEATVRFAERHRTWAVWFVLLGCFLFASILMLFLLVLTGQTHEVMRLVSEKTRELDEAKRRLEDQYRVKAKLAQDLSEQTAKLKNQQAALLNVLEDSEQARRRAEEAESRIAEAMKLKSEFTSVVSHELRTPLTVIKEAVSLVQDGSAGVVNSTQAGFLSTAKRNVERLARLINEVLDFQRFESGKMPIEFRSVSVNDLISENLPSLRALADTKKLTLGTELDLRIQPIPMDKDKIIQVLMNYVSNAVKFTERGTITIRTALSAEGVKLSVEDQGRGIRVEDQQRLFQSFSQIREDNMHKTGGTGLGLAICKKIADAHGGRVGVESVYGRGSIFFIVLPLDKTHKT